MRQTGSQESSSSSSSNHTYRSQSSQSPASPPSPSPTRSYRQHANPYGSPTSRGATSGSSPTSPRHPCLYPGCLHTSARPYDLDRHMKTHFPEAVSRLDCPYARGGFCRREGERGFTREDHRKEHVRKVHPVRR